jgi:uncharacterized protein YndB with AHSA1/START domain
VWALWTTKDGIESWWGPEGFSVTVQHLDLRPGGELRYTMTATAPDQVAFMRQAGMPLATEVSFTPEPDGVQMVLRFSAMHDDEWTQRARLGHESELARLEAILRGQP